MTSKIIALVDGSTYSKSVCELAAWAALRSGAPVDVLHVIGRRNQAGTHDLSGSIALGARIALLSELSRIDEERARLMQQRGRAIVEDGKAILTSAGVGDVTARLRMGDLVETVAEQEREASLIVIGKRGEAADFATLHLGSNLERIARASTRPVLVAARAYREIRKVLIAWDGGVSSQKAVDHIARNRLFGDLDLTIATVGQPSAEIEKGHAAARAVLAAAGFSARTATVPGQPDKALGQLVADEGFDMVVMGAYGHSRIRNLVIGSTTTEMIRSCKVPIYLIR
jgi:nucleotide-binding universal stress UspA family protein